MWVTWLCSYIFAYVNSGEGCWQQILLGKDWRNQDWKRNGVIAVEVGQGVCLFLWAFSCFFISFLLCVCVLTRPGCYRCSPVSQSTHCLWSLFKTLLWLSTAVCNARRPEWVWIGMNMARTLHTFSVKMFQTPLLLQSGQTMHITRCEAQYLC